MIRDIIKDFEQSYNAKVIYVTVYGSKLFGTDSIDSDTDYKGIFIPSKRDVLLKRDIEHYNYNTNNKTKNSKQDIDLQLFSIYKWFTLLKKGETGALDLLFSLFREDTQVHNDFNFTKKIKDDYYKFYNKNLHSFIGYCVGQSKMYNIKGQRYNELKDFIELFSKIEIVHKDSKISEFFSEIEKIFEQKEYKFIRFVKAAISRGDQPYKEGIFIEILGKKFSATVTVGYFITQIKQMQQQFGNRTKGASKGVDYKALSHAVRVISEVEELLDDGFITFPLKNKEYIKSIKFGREKLENVMDYIDEKLNIVQNKLANSNLPEKSDEKFIDELILEFLR